MLHLIVGNTGAGKTTYANRLKTETNGIVFSIDAWNNTLFFPDKKTTDGLEWILERMERIEAIVMRMVHQLEASGIDSILDLGFAKTSHRNKFREFARESGYTVQTHFLDVPSSVRLQRVQQRNEDQGDSFEFVVTQENFEFMEEWFEPPGPDEMEEGLIVKT